MNGNNRKKGLICIHVNLVKEEKIVLSFNSHTHKHACAHTLKCQTTMKIENFIQS